MDEYTLWTNSKGTQNNNEATGAKWAYYDSFFFSILFFLDISYRRKFQMNSYSPLLLVPFKAQAKWQPPRRRCFEYSPDSCWTSWISRTKNRAHWTAGCSSELCVISLAEIVFCMKNLFQGNRIAKGLIRHSKGRRWTWFNDCECDSVVLERVY